MNRLDKSEWIHAIPSHPSTVSIEHCKPGKRKLYITLKEDGTFAVAYCHHCGLSGSHKLDGAGCESPSSTLDWSRPIKRLVSLPLDVMSDPEDWGTSTEGMDARAWLLSYVGEDIARDSAICWSEFNKGLVFPYFHEGNLVGYQLRKFPASADSKYITVGIKDAPYTDPFLTRHTTTGIPALAIVEDYVSALWVSANTTLDALPLRGTRLTKTMRAAIVKYYADVVVALDNDTPKVKEAQAKIVRELSGYCNVRTLFLNKDPKDMSIAEIRAEFDPYEW